VTHGLTQDGPIAADQRVEQQKIGNRREARPSVESSAERQQFELHPEQPGQHQTEPEDGHAHASQGKDHAAMVECRAAAPGRDNAGWQTDQHREEHRHYRQLGCGREALGQLSSDGVIATDGATQIALQNVAHEDGVLRRPRLIEPIRRAQLRECIWRGVLAKDRTGRIARDQVQEQKDDDADADKHRRQRHQTPKCVSDQRRGLRTED